MNLSISARIVLGFAIALLALVIIGVAASRNISRLDAHVDTVKHTLEVLQEKERLSAGLFELQSLARGYALGGGAAGEQFDARAADVERAFGTLRALTQDNPTQQRRLAALEPLLERRIAASRGLMQVRSSTASPPGDAVAALVAAGDDLGRDLRGFMEDIESEEQRLLATRERDSEAAQASARATLRYGTLAAFVFVALVSLFLTRSIRGQLLELVRGTGRLAGGDYTERVRVQSQDEVGRLATAFNSMAQQIEERQNASEADNWLKSSLTQVSALFHGERRLDMLASRLLQELARLLDAQHATMYVHNDAGLELLATYAADAAPKHIAPGQGLIGQVLSDRRRVLLNDLPADYIRIRSALGETSPASVAIVPALLGGEVKAVIELAFLKTCGELQLTFLERLAESLGLVVTTIQSNERTEKLLTESQALSDELRVNSQRLQESEQLLKEQQEELRQTNEELEQANEELQQANEEMEERANLLAEQKLGLERSNKEVEESRKALERQSAQLAQTSKYKSEFLANMSHELRTPLNSLLILSNVLADNSDGNLTPKQVQHAKTINASGTDLLDLINEILDLSKIEAGAVDLDVTEVRFDTFADFIEHTFRPIAEQKRLQFAVRLDPALGAAMYTDLRRLQQIVKNLLSNALKFTHQGTVELTIRPATHEWLGKVELLDTAKAVCAFEVRDTGIGIPPNRLQLIFEAFQQADVGTARKYGGTGLGLSISRELAQRLGGTLQVASEEGKGSVFTLYLPREATSAQLTYVAGQMAQDISSVVQKSEPRIEPRHAAHAELEPSAIEDDREAVQPGDLTLLAIEDDVQFAQVIADFARDKGFKAILAQTAAGGLALARRLRPTAITLDLRLPDADGRMVLDLLKHDPSTRHIPVHVISVDEARDRMLRAGAVSFLQKPVTKDALDGALAKTVEFVKRPMKNLLIVEDDEVQRRALVELIGESDVSTVAVGSAAAALEQVKGLAFDCIVVDLVLPDLSGAELIRAIHEQLGPAAPPVIVYTAKTLSRAEETELRRLSEAIILKDARSPERLLDETALFLHRVQAKLPEPKRKLLEQVQREDPVLSARKVLIVDDDVRNIFAITTALESYRMQVIYAESGRGGIELLEANPDVDAILMDVMMPEMDGFETTQRIRRMDRFRDLPIIMVTAKAMKGDREKCLAAGASDYITKPVDMDQLRSLLRVWLYR